MIEAINIHKIYKNGAKELSVLKGIDLKIEKGEFISILGPSGAGKSTFLHILGGLDDPTQGDVIVESQDLYKLSDKKRAQIRNRIIGFVFQFYHLLPEFSALENVLLPALISCQRLTTSDQRLNKARALLELVGLRGRMNHRPNELSGGEQQRVAIARALVNEPKVLLCDEPTGNLDSETGKGIIDLLHKFNKEAGAALVVVTHEEGIAKLADRVMYMKDGRMG